ncbi:hypothetical protein [Candidatus Thiosymbion oneisti]|uniref:hypothetical protein n=1 Tax=Candidatus Thiosymbion oneisti TaxID=589554 RepID=UPI00114CD7B0|nr:hypothetical protein [Candidatus Thiosymbion oneisti]
MTYSREYTSSSAPTSRNTNHWSVQNGAPTLKAGNEQAARERRVTALRSWLDSLPEVPSVPAHAIDRSELY